MTARQESMVWFLISATIMIVLSRGDTQNWFAVGAGVFLMIAALVYRLRSDK